MKYASFRSVRQANTTRIITPHNALNRRKRARANHILHIEWMPESEKKKQKLRLEQLLIPCASAVNSIYINVNTTFAIRSNRRKTCIIKQRSKQHEQERAGFVFALCHLFHVNVMSSAKKKKTKHYILLNRSCSHDWCASNQPSKYLRYELIAWDLGG